MALTDQQKVDFLYQIIRKEKLDGERLSKFTTDAPRWIGQLVADLKLPEEDVRDLAQPFIASIIYDLAEAWGLLSKLDSEFRVEQDLKKKFKNK